MVQKIDMPDRVVSSSRVFIPSTELPLLFNRGLQVATA
jgi:hypothetical protein